MMSDSDTMRLFSAGILTSSVVVNWQVLSLSEMPQKNEALYSLTVSLFASHLQSTLMITQSMTAWPMGVTDQKNSHQLSSAVKQNYNF